MGRIYSNRPARDTETAAESPVITNMAGSLPGKRSIKSQLTVAEQHESNKQIDDFGEKKSNT